ncbi:protocatechuate 4,5-dioxygenase subunit alpha/beta [Demequina sp. SYSU T00039]|uniref:Protocatechuate 4,5-dioxygenase subunit alpha/beta n=1 Tax=Demequina lignilytica TaxID=3051663 RepID=A0AAW7M1E2_9MICO|nr:MULTISPECIES: protocatechuate 4,5-dioxygenase subunit alpha/beta [unclassified Demequina]MDN4477395.1 protocatechuate 4,5-dioxygenase subunit alpha/beta [Demequina sp. SYSU T00039-1]MDN4488254.1 protocatechuate 4,5-dioxygenase subunit alpha/beta [Demequina sp. SYSU T00039]
MALDKPYKKIPGTIIFDAEMARKGYHLNQFSMSLMKPENRERYLADRAAYLDEWPLSPAQRQAVLDLDLNAMMAEGGNIYFLSKIGATHGLSFQQMAGSMTGMSEAAYRDMMIEGGRRPEGVRLKDLDGWTPPSTEKATTMRKDAPAAYTSALFTSHVPAIGAAMDLGKTEEPYWKKVFAGYEWTRKWAKENTPDVIILVYNDHATAFDSSLIPTFVLGTGAHYPVADEGYGPRPVPDVYGHPELAAHIAQSVIQDDFDLTLVNEMVVDHGLTVPLSLVFGDVDEWPCKIIPLPVNVVQYPVPSGRRCYELGKAIRRALDKWDGEPLNVQIWGTGGMSHQLQGPRAGLINEEWDNAFLDHLIADPKGLTEWPHMEYVDEAGSEGIELVDWLIARGAMDDQFEGEAPTVDHRFYHVPASNTAVGHLVISNPVGRTAAAEEAESQVASDAKPEVVHA